MDFSEAIENIMPFVSDPYNTEPFIISGINGQWTVDFQPFTQSTAKAQLDFTRQTDPFAIMFTSADFSNGSYPYVYDKILAARFRAEYELEYENYRPESLMRDELCMLVEFIEDSAGELSSEATAYLTTLDEPLAWLYEICPFSAIDGFDTFKATEFAALIERKAGEIQSREQTAAVSANADIHQNKRVIEGYTETNSFRLSDRLVVLAENDEKDLPYLVCEARWDNPLGCEEYSYAIATDDYLEAVDEFVRRVSGLSEYLRHEYKRAGIPFQALNDDNCVPNGLDENLEGKLVIINPKALSPEFRTASRQLKIAKSGFGCASDSRGSAVFCEDLYSGKESRLERSDILGVADVDTLPEWARKKLALRDAIQEPGVFEYNGYHFKPYRKFHEGETDRRLKGDSRSHKKDMQYAMRNMATDAHLNFRNDGSAEAKWSYEDFYAASENCNADIFILVENGKLYVPTEGELFQYTESPQRSKSKNTKPSLLGQLNDAKLKVAEDKTAHNDKPTAKKRGDMEV